MKERLEKLFVLATEFHMELSQLAMEIDSSELWEAEGAMQDVKSSISEEYCKEEHNN